MCNLRVRGGNLSEPSSGPLERVILQWKFQMNQKTGKHSTAEAAQLKENFRNLSDLESSEEIWGYFEYCIYPQFSTTVNCANKTMCLSQVFVIQHSRIEQNRPKIEQNQGNGPSRAFPSAGLWCSNHS